MEKGRTDADDELSKATTTAAKTAAITVKECILKPF